MKKFISVSIAMLTPFLVTANYEDSVQHKIIYDGITIKSDVRESTGTDDVVCVQVTQAAINTQGECKNFSTPCEVPKNWKKVSSCENFEDVKEKRTSIAENTRRRHSDRWAKLREKAKERMSQKNSLKNSQQIARLRSSHRFVKNNQEQEDTSLDRKTNTRKNWNSSFRKFVSPARQKMIDKKKKLQESKEETRKVNLKRRVSGSATNMVRSGKLSNKFWSTQRNKRRNNLETSTDAIKQGLRSRQPFRKAKPKRVTKDRHAQLRSTYRGVKSQGNINGTSE